MTVKWVQRSLIYSPIYIAICTSSAAFAKVCRSYGVRPYAWLNDDADATCHNWSKNGKRISIICVPPRGKRSRSAYAALIVHEAVHVWQAIKDSISESSPSAEFEAYSLQNITQNLFEAVGL